MAASLAPRLRRLRHGGRRAAADRRVCARPDATHRARTPSRSSSARSTRPGIAARPVATSGGPALGADAAGAARRGRRGGARSSTLGLGAGAPLVGRPRARAAARSSSGRVERFARGGVARSASVAGAAIVLTGGAGDARPRGRGAAGRWPTGAVACTRSPATLDLLTLAAVLARCALLVTGDTGPMHLAAAVGTPIVAVFGPSTPRRYGPLVRPRRTSCAIDLPVQPRATGSACRRSAAGHTPDCLDGVGG